MKQKVPPRNRVILGDSGCADYRLSPPPVRPVLVWGCSRHRNRWYRDRLKHFKLRVVDPVLILQQERGDQSLLLSAELGGGQDCPALFEVCGPRNADALHRLDVIGNHQLLWRLVERERPRSDGCHQQLYLGCRRDLSWHLVYFA